MMLLTGWSGAVMAQTAPGNLSLDHVGIHAADIDRSVAFYTTVLGLKEAPAPFPRAAARWIDLGEGRKLHIVAGGTPGRLPDKWDHFALSSSNLDALIISLDSQHVAWSDMEQGRKTIQTRPDGTRQIFLRDPDGYSIEINDGATHR